MIKKIKKKIAEWTMTYRIWVDRREIYGELKRELRASGLNGNFEMHDEEHQLREGVVAMKVVVNRLIKDKSSESYEKILMDINDLAMLAEKMCSKEEENLIKLRKKLVVFKGKDIRTKEDKEKMIVKRIQDYNKLHRSRESRELRRKERRARNAKDYKLANELLQEWKEKYG